MESLVFILAFTFIVALRVNSLQRRKALAGKLIVHTWVDVFDPKVVEVWARLETLIEKSGGMIQLAPKQFVDQVFARPSVFDGNLLPGHTSLIMIWRVEICLKPRNALLVLLKHVTLEVWLDRLRFKELSFRPKRTMIRVHAAFYQSNGLCITSVTVTETIKNSQWQNAAKKVSKKLFTHLKRAVSTARFFIITFLVYCDDLFTKSWHSWHFYHGLFDS